jgi:hypothetical protein
MGLKLPPQMLVYALSLQAPIGRSSVSLGANYINRDWAKSTHGDRT